MINKKPFWIMLIIDLLALLFVVFAKPIVLFTMATLPTCIFFKLGYQCPACGGTRCFFSIFNLDFVSAFNYNPFIFVLLFYVLIIFVCLNLHYLLGYQKPKNIIKAMINPKIVISFAILFCVFGLLRNFI